jgi:hypothetical protein
VPKVHNGVQMCWKGINETLFLIIAPSFLGEVLRELQGPTAMYTSGSTTEGLVGFIWMTGTRTVLDCLDTVVFSLLKCAPFILTAI